MGLGCNILYMAFGFSSMLAIYTFKKIKGRKVFNPKDIQFPGGFYKEMNRYEAIKILGINGQLTEKKIMDKHRKIMLQNHPDISGSNFLASKINEAKEFLLKEV